MDRLKLDQRPLYFYFHNIKIISNCFFTCRVKQVEELMDSYIKKSKADAVILGGDFNTPPLMDPGQPYEIIQRYMKNSCAEFWAKMEEWLLPKFATYGNAHNSFSYIYNHITYHYVFHKS